jgi:tetratricopeptide (TPR) repeat protein
MGSLVRALFFFLALLPAVAVAQSDRVKQAKDKFEAGKTAYRLGDYDGAIAHWTEAYKLNTDPVFLYNIAQAYREKKDFEKAISFYRNYLREAPDAGNRATVEKRIAEMQEALEERQRLAEKPPSAPLGPAAEAPPAPSPRDEQRGRGPKIAGVVTGSAGVALVVTGVVLGLMSKSDKDDIQQAIDMGQPWSQELADTQSSGENKARLANITIGVGIAAVVGGGVLYYLGVRQGKSVEVRPEVSAGRFGAAILVRY